MTKSSLIITVSSWSEHSQISSRQEDQLELLLSPLWISGSSLSDDVQPIVKIQTHETTVRHSIETDSVSMPVMSLPMPTDISKNKRGFYKKISLANKKVAEFTQETTLSKASIVYGIPRTTINRWMVCHGLFRAQYMIWGER